MYRTNDPRFRRRLNEIGQTLESANETAQSSIYIFGQTYVKPCLHSVGTCLTACVDASCPSLNLNLTQRDRLRRQRERGRTRGRAELNFDFYDDWDDDENDGLLGWGNDDFGSLVAGGGAGTAGTGGGVGAGYGTVLPQNTQPARQARGGMIYPSSKKGSRRKSGANDPATAGLADPTVIQPGPSSLFGKLFGGKALRYKPSAAGLQEHPGTRRLAYSSHGLTEGEQLLGVGGEYDEYSKSHRSKAGRARSGTQASATTTDSYSSRGDLFPSDEEADAVPLDDEFAMVLERRTTLSLGAETESSGDAPGKLSRSSTDDLQHHRTRSKRASTGSRTSTRRTLSERSLQSNPRRGRSSHANSIVIVEDAAPMPDEDIERAVEALQTQDEADESPFNLSNPHPPRREISLSDLKREEQEAAVEEEAAIERRRSDAQKLALERGLTAPEVNTHQSKAETDISVPSPASNPGLLPARRSPNESKGGQDPAPLPKPHQDSAEEEELKS